MEVLVLILLIWFLFQGGSGRSGGGCRVKQRPTTPRPNVTVYPQYRKKT